MTYSSEYVHPRVQGETEGWPWTRGSITRG